LLCYLKKCLSIKTKTLIFRNFYFHVVVNIKIMSLGCDAVYLSDWIKRFRRKLLSYFHGVTTCVKEIQYSFSRANYFSLTILITLSCCGPFSSVGIATGYGLDGPVIESWREIFRTCPDRPWGPPSLLYNGYRVFPEGRKRPGRDADPSPLLVLRSIKQSRAIPLLSLRAFVDCKKG
jgi:hypothetical protein